MPKKKYCLCCDEPFTPTSGKQEYCTRKCYKKHYNKTCKTSDYPFYSCPDCGERTKLDFFPKRNQKMWDELICPNCGEPRKNTELI